MSKEEAIKAMENGHKVFHNSFLPQEYIYMKGEWIYDEEGYFCHSSVWWSHRNGLNFETGWKILGLD